MIFKENDYGLYKSTFLYKANNDKSPTGDTSISTDFEFYKTTKNVPLTLGIQFGVEFIINSKYDKYIELEFVWAFPTKIKNDAGKEFYQYKRTSTVKTNTKTWTGYKLNKNYEMVKGTWILEIFYKDKKLYQKEFLVE